MNLDYIVVAEYGPAIVGSAVTGQMTLTELPEIVRLHAVARDASGALGARTACGRWYALPKDEGEVPWQDAKLGMQCETCAEQAGTLPSAGQA